MLRNDQLDAWDRENFFHPSTHLADFARGDLPNRIVMGGTGCHIEDRDGNRLLDGFAYLRVCPTAAHVVHCLIDCLVGRVRVFFQ